MGAVRETRPRARRRALSRDLVQSRHSIGLWHVERRYGTPRALHSWSDLSPGHHRLVRVCECLTPAVVIGSTQPAEQVNEDRCRAAGFDVVRRRSGGGAVLVQPSAQLWVDIFIPRSDPLFSPDVSRSFMWLGEAWADALRRMAPDSDWEVKDAPSPKALQPWIDKLCFLGAVPGEVFDGPRKIVGCSQRRDRHGAWFHSMAVLEAATALPSLLELDDGERESAEQALSTLAGVVPGGQERSSELRDAVIAELTSR